MLASCMEREDCERSMSEDRPAMARDMERLWWSKGAVVARAWEVGGWGSWGSRRVLAVGDAEEDGWRGSVGDWLEANGELVATGWEGTSTAAEAGHPPIPKE